MESGSHKRWCHYGTGQNLVRRVQIEKLKYIVLQTCDSLVPGVDWAIYDVKTKRKILIKYIKAIRKDKRYHKHNTALLLQS